MKDKWIDDLRSQLSNPSAKAPAGLWEDIENALPPRSRRFAAYKTLTIAASGIAAAIAVVLAFVFYRDGDSTALMQTETAEVSLRAPGSANKSVEIIKQSVSENNANQAEKLTASVSKAEVSASYSHDDENAFQNVQNESKNDSQQQPAPAPTDNKDEEKPATPVAGTQPDYIGENYGEAAYTASPKSKSRLSMSISAGNPFGQSRSETSPTLFTNFYPSMAGTASGDSTILKSPRRKHTAELPIALKHHLPMKIGLKVRYSLTDAFSLETGLIYNLLKADGNGYSLGREVNASQQLHYLGIPLNAVLSVWDYRRFGLYASAGATVEKCISGRTEYKIYDRSGETFATEHSSTMVKPLQFSVNASLGFQLSLTDKLALYLEPGISYYFKNGSPVETYYSEKPLNFNLLTGFRLSF